MTPGHDTTALRKLLLEHQPTLFRNRCSGCRHRIGCSPIPFPCTIWHQARIALGLLHPWPGVSLPQLPLPHKVDL
ncbi:MAG: hypothetical protein JO272_02045 [Pseudonocardiales bacterium]|nr:hypothetical protein [Pseudonocardiales bacterium]